MRIHRTIVSLSANGTFEFEMVMIFHLHLFQSYSVFLQEKETVSKRRKPKKEMTHLSHYYDDLLH